MSRRALRGPGPARSLRATGGLRGRSLTSVLLVAVAVPDSPTRVRLFMSETQQRDSSRTELHNAQGVPVDFGEMAFEDLDATAMSVPVPRLDPGIDTVAWNTRYTWISQAIGGAAMRAFSDQLTDQERWDLRNFVRDNGDRPLEAPPAAEDG